MQKAKGRRFWAALRKSPIDPISNKPICFGYNRGGWRAAYTRTHTENAPFIHSFIHLRHNSPESVSRHSTPIPLAPPGLLEDSVHAGCFRGEECPFAHVSLAAVPGAERALAILASEVRDWLEQGE
jgi:hypothetical protein